MAGMARLGSCPPIMSAAIAAALVASLAGGELRVLPPSGHGRGLTIRRFGIPVLPLILGVILGPLMEIKLREALDLSGGVVSGLFNEGLAIFVYVLVVLALVLPIALGRLRAGAATTAKEDARR